MFGNAKGKTSVVVLPRIDYQEFFQVVELADSQGSKVVLLSTPAKVERDSFVIDYLNHVCLNGRCSLFKDTS